MGKVLPKTVSFLINSFGTQWQYSNTLFIFSLHAYFISMNGTHVCI